jgi:hypothetical protein
VQEISEVFLDLNVHYAPCFDNGTGYHFGNELFGRSRGRAQLPQSTPCSHVEEHRCALTSPRAGRAGCIHVRHSARGPWPASGAAGPSTSALPTLRRVLSRSCRTAGACVATRVTPTSTTARGRIAPTATAVGSGRRARAASRCDGSRGSVACCTAHTDVTASVRQDGPTVRDSIQSPPRRQNGARARCGASRARRER